MTRFEIMKLLLDLSSRQLEPCMKTINTMVLQLSNTIEEILKAVDEREGAASTIITFDANKKESNQRLSSSGDSSKVNASKLLSDLQSQKEKLSALGEQIQGQVMEFMGLLSLEDVISQRFEHILHNMERAGSKILEASQVNTIAEAESIMGALHEEIKKSFTMTAEKDSFKSFFKGA